MQELALSKSAYLGRQMEIIAAFSTGGNASTGNSTAQSPFAVGLQLDTGNGTYTRISINGTSAALQTGELQIMQVTSSHIEGLHMGHTQRLPAKAVLKGAGVMPGFFGGCLLGAQFWCRAVLGSWSAEGTCHRSRRRIAECRVKS